MDENGAAPSHPMMEFLRLESSARAALTVSDLGFHMVNETHRLIHYRQAFFCSLKGPGLILETISGLASVDRHTPFYDWFAQLGHFLASHKSERQPLALSRTDVPERICEEWDEWLPAYLLLVPLLNREEDPQAFLILAREEPFADGDQRAVHELAQVYGHALSALVGSRPVSRRLTELAANRRFQFATAFFFIIIFLLPVRQSSLGPAEVTPLTYSSISSPLDGVIATVLVKPNENVRKGQPLFRLDDTTIRNRLESAYRTMGVAKSEEFLSRQKSFTDTQSRGELATQEARVREKGSTIGYMRELLEKMDVRAPADGVVLFGDPSDWEGKPVATGERVMMLADEMSACVTIWLPAADAVALDAGRRVRFFLHTEPLRPRDGTVIKSSYQPVVSPDGIASYRVTALFDTATVIPRLGLKGTAKVYGDRVSIGYYLFRRPIAAIRQWLGW